MISKGRPNSWLARINPTREHHKQAIKKAKARPHDCEAVEYVQESGFSEGELATYEKYWDGVSAERTLLADAIAEGEAKGRVESELLGQQKLAIKMLRKGLGVEEVSAIAEIEAEEILRLSRLLQEFGPAAKEHCAR